jgi:hypothetical protein
MPRRRWHGPGDTKTWKDAVKIARKMSRHKWKAPPKSLTGNNNVVGPFLRKAADSITDWDDLR